MAEERVKALIRQYDDLVRFRQTLPDYNFAEELRSVLPTCMKYREIDSAQLRDKSKECEKLTERLEIALDFVAKSCMQFEDRTKHYQILLNNNHAKEFLEFSNILKTRNESYENAIAVLKSENDILKSELEALKLNNMALNSSLNLANESLNEEKSQREQIESERNNLEYLSEKLGSLLLKCQQQIRHIEEMKEMKTRASCDDSNSLMIESDSDIVLRIDTSTSEDSLDVNNLSDLCDYDDELPILPPFGFRDERVSPVKNIDSHELFSNKQDDYVETNTLDETSNLSVWRKLRERDPIKSSNHFVNKSPSSLPTPVNDLPVQSDVVDFEIDYLHPMYDSNTPIDNSKSTAMKSGHAVDLLENSTIDPIIQKFSVPLEMNENLSSSPKTSSNRRQKSIVQEDELPNLITPVEQHFTCDICGKSFLKKSGLICHTRVHVTNNSQSFHCEKCGKSFAVKRKGKKILKCPNCDVRYITRGRKNEVELTSGLSEWKNNGDESADIDNIHRKCENRNSIAHCIICDKHYSSVSVLNQHIRIVHNGEKPYKCTECGKRFGRISHLKTHTLVHGSQKPFKCSVCHKGFKDMSNKIMHERILHEEGARLQCAHCDKLFGRKQTLISHIHTKHFSGFQKQFKCTICDKSFALKYQLQFHMFSHSSKKSFKCSVCDCTFKYLCSKTHHEKTVHGKGALFRCNHCDKVYQQKAYFIRHLQKNHAE